QWLRAPFGRGGTHEARYAVRPFTEKQIELLTTFADQGVIAIENARLFEEVQARTRELSQSIGELRALGEVSQSGRFNTLITHPGVSSKNNKANGIYERSGGIRRNLFGRSRRKIAK